MQDWVGTLGRNKEGRATELAGCKVCRPPPPCGLCIQPNSFLCPGTPRRGRYCQWKSGSNYLRGARGRRGEKACVAQGGKWLRQPEPTSKNFTASGGGARLTGTGPRLLSAFSPGLRYAGFLSSLLWNSHPGKRVGQKDGCPLGHGERTQLTSRV